MGGRHGKRFSLWPPALCWCWEKLPASRGHMFTPLVPLVQHGGLCTPQHGRSKDSQPREGSLGPGTSGAGKACRQPEAARGQHEAQSLHS